MVLFCPFCGNTLLIEFLTNLQWYCMTCPYVSPLQQAYRKVVPLQRKKVDDVLGGEDAWKNVDQTDATCPTCGHERAFFIQIQIRSADEPSTTFYRCASSACSKTWCDR